MWSVLPIYTNKSNFWALEQALIQLWQPRLNTPFIYQFFNCRKGSSPVPNSPILDNSVHFRCGANSDGLPLHYTFAEPFTVHFFTVEYSFGRSSRIWAATPSVAFTWKNAARTSADQWRPARKRGPARMSADQRGSSAAQRGPAPISAAQRGSARPSAAQRGPRPSAAQRGSARISADHDQRGPARISADQRGSARTSVDQRGPTRISADQRGSVRTNADQPGSARISAAQRRISADQRASTPISADQHQSAGISSEIFHRSPWGK